MEFIIEQGHRVNWVSGSLDSRVTGSLGHKMRPSSVSAADHGSRRQPVPAVGRAGSDQLGARVLRRLDRPRGHCRHHRRQQPAHRRTGLYQTYQCSRIRIFRFFSDFKKTWLYVFFEMTYQKVVKSHQQKFGPQYVTKEWSLRSMIAVIQFLAAKSHCTCVFIHNRKNKPSDWGQSSWPCLRPFKPQTVAEAAVVGLPGTGKQTSSGNVGQCQILTAVKRNNHIRQPYIRVSKLNIWLDYDANITK